MTMKRIIGLGVGFALVSMLAVFLIFGRGRWYMVEGGPTDPAPEPKTSGIFVSVPDDSILFFMANDGSMQLMRDMVDGRTPVSCNVLYDAMGSRPEVTVTDPDTIIELYNRLAQMTVGNMTTMSVTDAYHHIYFTLEDGTVVGWHFETEALLCMGSTNYEAYDNGNLWGLVQELQEQQL